MYAMSAKLAFVFLAALTVFVATAERSETSEAYRRFMVGDDVFLRGTEGFC